MIEFEIPFVCLIFSLLIYFVYTIKERAKLEENSYFKNVLIFTILVNLFNFISHYGASIYLVDTVDHWYADLFAIINKIGSWFIIIITINIMSYIFYISFEKYRKNFAMHKLINRIIILLTGIILIFLDFNVIKEGELTSGEGPAVIFSFGLVFLNLIIAFIVSLCNIKKYDKRYNSIYIIIPLIFILGIFVMFHPEFNIYDFILCLMCYLMYFTIENPDVKMIETVREARDQAERANRAKSDFLSSMSHEIRTPLNAIVGLSEDMQARGNCPDDMKDDLTDVVAASRTLLEIVGNIMDISKIESEKMEITNIPYKFKEEIESLARVTGSRIGDKPIEYKINIAEDIPYELIGDKGHIKEVINNLLSNSIKYTDKGFIELNARCINKGDKCLLIISVKDTGRGIKASDISKLFNKFERLEAEKNSTTEGTGLGLAITKKLVELMNGKINVESRYGVGSIFMVQIPQKISKMTKPLTEDELLNTVELDLKKKDLNYGDKRILIVDDNPLNIKVAKRNILPLGFMSIDEASNGQECLDKIRQGYKYDLILMDIMMPIMSGETALAELKKIPDFNTPVIALTADAIAGAEEKYRSQGFTDYVSKPFSKDIIKLKVDSIFVNQIKEEKKELENRWNDAPAAVFGIDSIDDLYKM